MMSTEGNKKVLILREYLLVQYKNNMGGECQLPPTPPVRKHCILLSIEYFLARYTTCNF